MKSKLYTRTGDSGETSLADGSRILKDDIRVEAYGTVDELSAAIGIIASNQECPERIRKQLIEQQNVMFSLGAYLATPTPQIESTAFPSLNSTGGAFSYESPYLKPVEHAVETLEHYIDTLDAETPEAKYFILPGGTPLAAYTHLARTICRKAERRVITLSATEIISPAVTSYLNRLSDYLFILARHFNHLADVNDIPWQK